MTGLIDKVQTSTISRRNFLKASAVTVSALGLTACGENKLSSLSSAEKVDAENGKWVPVPCWHGCGGKCLIKAYVVDGVVVRMKSDDTHHDSLDYPQQRACPRGYSQRQQVFGADRLKYPMKRKHWKPGGGDKSLRGKDEWERITWKEAFDYIAAEIENAYKKYGPKSVLLSGWDGQEITKILARKGGYVLPDNTASYGSWVINPVGMGTTFNNYNPDSESANDRFDLLNAETIVLYSCNPVWASSGTPTLNYYRAKEAGVKFVYVGPDYNMTASALDAKWIRVRPGTDTAFLLSVAYTMIVEDDPINNPIIDWDFLDRCTVGFDEAHLPVDAKLNENFKDYVLGKYDGKPKTPEWASEICGTPVEDIKWYAREMRKDKKVMLLHSYAAGRCNGAEDLPQLYMTIGAMGGHYGKSGHACGGTYHYEASNAAPGIIKMGYPRGSEYVPNPIKEYVPSPMMWKTLLDGKYHYAGSQFGPTNSFEPGEDRDIDIHLIYSEKNNFLQGNMDVNNGIKLYRKVDFAVANAYWFTLTAQYSDIVLPVTTQWEGWHQVDQNTGWWHNRETLFFNLPVTEPLYEAKSDQSIVAELATRLGIDPKELYPFSEKQQRFDSFAGAEVLEADGKTWSPVVTITQKDIEEFGIDNQPQQGKIGLKEVLKSGVYQVERNHRDNYNHISYEDFVKDPEKNPRESPSGKLEIYCQKKANDLNMLGFRDEKFKPYPTYHKPVLGYEESFQDWDNKVKGDYPYQIFTPHYLRRSHTTLDNPPWLREAFTNPVLINAQDAEEKGIKDGDTLLVYNQFGKILRHANVSNTIMPGCIALPHGARSDIDEKTGIDFGGNENVLLGPVTSNGLHISGYNTNLVNFEKYKGKPIPPDCEKPLIIVDVN
jgi:anaerobic dimethyl sulfoxide reductase subunit A